MNTKKMYENALLYDAQNVESRDDIQFFQKKAKAIGGPILELACGTGILSIPIATLGIEVYGLDVSNKMIELAIRKSTDLKNIHFTVGDMTNFKMDKKFKMIFCGFNSITHLHTFEAVQGMLLSVKEHLTSDGVFLIDCFVPNAKYFIRPKGALYPVCDRNGLKIQEENEYDSIAQINHVIWHYEYKNEKWIEYLDMRLYYPQELQNYLHICGFTILKSYGTHGFEELKENSSFQIYECGIK